MGRMSKGVYESAESEGMSPGAERRRSLAARRKKSSTHGFRPAINDLLNAEETDEEQ